MSYRLVKWLLIVNVVLLTACEQETPQERTIIFKELSENEIANVGVILEVVGIEHNIENEKGINVKSEDVNRIYYLYRTARLEEYFNKPPVSADNEFNESLALVIRQILGVKNVYISQCESYKLISVTVYPFYSKFRVRGDIFRLLGNETSGQFKVVVEEDGILDLIMKLDYEFKNSKGAGSRDMLTHAD